MARKRRFSTITEYMGRAGSRGFTLVELAISIVIIAILVAVVVPVLLNSQKHADKATAEYNLKEGGYCIDRVWFKILDEGVPPDGIESYRDWQPPDPLKVGAEYQTNGWVPVSAQYLSTLETRIIWADLGVTSAGGGGAAQAQAERSDAFPVILAEGGAAFTVRGIWNSGTQIMGEVAPTDWSVLPGKICVVYDKYYWDGAWQENPDNYWITLITLEHSGVAHYLSMNAGKIMDYGYFNWDNGAGNPGEGWKDEEDPPADDPPPADDDPPPADDDPPPGDVEPPPADEDPPPGDVEPPPGDEDPPPGDEEPPPGDEEPPPGPQPYDFVASCEIKPETLNLSSNGQFTAFVELAGGYTADDIDISTVTCCGAIAVDIKENENGRIIIKFDREELLNVQTGDNIVLTVNGLFLDGQEFEGYDMVRVIDNGN